MQTDPKTARDPGQQTGPRPVGQLCGGCGAENGADAGFCWRCYAAFRPVSTLPAAPVGAPVGLSTSPGLGAPRLPGDAGVAVKKRRSKRGLIGVAVVLAIGVVGALNRTEFEIPESIDGVPRMHDQLATEYEAAVRAWATESDDLQLQGAVYGTGARPAFVVGAVDEAVRNDTDDILNVVVGSLTVGGRSVASLSGEDGGLEYRCVQATSQMSVCVWKESDNSGFVGAVGRSPQQTLELTRTVRDAIEA